MLQQQREACVASTSGHLLGLLEVEIVPQALLALSDNPRSDP